MKNTLKIILQTQDVSFIRYTSNVGETIQCQHGRRHCLPFKLHFYNDEFYLSLFPEHPKGWILQKPQVRTTSEKNEAQRGTLS